MDQNFSNALSAPQTSFPDHQLQAPHMQAAQKKKKRFLFIILALLALSFLGGTGYVLAQYGYIELPLPFLEKETEEVLQKTIELSRDIQSAHFISHIDVSAALKNFAGIASPEMLGVERSADEGDVSNLSLSLVTEGDWKTMENAGDQQARSKGVFKWEGLTVEFDVEIKQIGDSTYFKVYQMPPIPLLGLLTGGVDFKEQWFKFDAKELTEKGIYSNAPQIGDISEETKQKAIRLVDTFASALLIEKLKGERLNGVKTYHYGLSFDTEKLKGALTETGALLPELLSLTEIGEAEAQKGEQGWSAFLEQKYESVVVPHVRALHTEVWIGKKDFFLRKIAMRYALPQAPQSTGDTKDEMDAYDIFDALALALDYQFSTINEPVAIEAPENPKDFMEALQNGPFGEARLKSRNAKRMADIRTVQSALEIYNVKTHDAMYPKDEAKDWDTLMKLLGISGATPPNEFADYCYYVSNDQKAFIASTQLEGENQNSGTLQQDIDLSKNSLTLISSSSPDESTCADPQKPVIMLCSSSANMCVFGGAPNSIILEPKASTGVSEEVSIGSKLSDAQDSDDDGLADELEALFGTDLANPDTDGDGYKDGVEVENGYNPLGEGKLDDERHF